MKRKDELIYKKRHYLLPFKPLLDREYRKFGYRKCDVEKEKKSLFHTVFYVRHKECRTGLRLSILGGINYLLSLYRVIVAPFSVLLLPVAVLAASIWSGFNYFLLSVVIMMAITPVFALLSVCLSSSARKVYKKAKIAEKADRALKNNGWDLWSSYTDNDDRFCPPGYEWTDSSDEDADDADEEDVGDLVTLLSDKGEEIDFTRIADIAYGGKCYAMLKPVELLDGMDDDEVLVFEVTVGADDHENFSIVTDDGIIEHVFDEYHRLSKN